VGLPIAKIYRPRVVSAKYRSMIALSTMLRFRNWWYASGPARL